MFYFMPAGCKMGIDQCDLIFWGWGEGLNLSGLPIFKAGSKPILLTQ